MVALFSVMSFVDEMLQQHFTIETDEVLIMLEDVVVIMLVVGVVLIMFADVDLQTVV
jgi:hypothetical protein